MSTTVRRVLFPVRIENYVPLIAQVARKYWASLPQSRKNWVDPSDLINDAVTIVQQELLPKYQCRKAAFTTILKLFLEHHFSNYVKAARCQKRDYGIAVPIEDIAYLLAGASNLPTLTGMTATKLLLDIYEKATPLLRYYMCIWFFHPDGTQSITNGAAQSKARKEFLHHAKSLGVTAETCRAFFTAKETGTYLNGYQRKVVR